MGSGDRAFSLEARLTLASGVLVLFGPSGVGKTLTLQAIAGLLPRVRGRVSVGATALLDSRLGVNVPARSRAIGFVPQQQNLFPFLDVLGNVGFGLPRAQRRSKEVMALLDELGLARLARARPDALSGGERQRVALGRALAVGPRLVLLDEPFASIDDAGRGELRSLVRELLGRRGTPAVLVTHARDDALAMGDELVLFERGRTLRSGSPRALLAPRSVRVTGSHAGAVEPLAGARARVALSSATIEGPAELIAAAALDVDLDSRT